MIGGKVWIEGCWIGKGEKLWILPDFEECTLNGAVERRTADGDFLIEVAQVVNGFTVSKFVPRSNLTVVPF